MWFSRASLRPEVLELLLDLNDRLGWDALLEFLLFLNMSNQVAY